jgi:hypothetical protein
MDAAKSLVTLAALCMARVIAAAPVPSDPAPAATLTEIEVTAPALIHPGAPDTDTVCQDDSGPALIDRMQAGLYRTVCLTAARFDGFFGNARFEDEYEATHGSVSAGMQWDERDHWDPSVRFRANVQLPQLSERFRAFVGRLDPDEYVSDTRDDFDSLPRQFGDEDDSVLLGLGYRQPGRRGGYFDTSVGIDLDWPPDPYVKGRYHLALPFLDRNLMRLNETIFWRADDGFGTTTRLDLERLLSEAFLVRWTGSGTFSEETEGVKWYSNVTLYQNLGAARAFAYQVGIEGETDREVDVTDYGLRVIFRRRIHRDWLYLELRSSVTWPREALLEDRETNWGGGVALEMQFGDRKRAK